jgi:L-threonylcarbamoyladenylate synthase
MEIVKVSEIGLDAAAAKAAAVVAQGGIVVYPTDTLYGLGVNALDREALARLRALKVREKKKPMSILVPSVEAIEWHAELTPAAKTLAERFFPGALTLVVPAKPHVPDDITQNGSIGVRIPDDAFSRAFSMMSEYPVTATSANQAGIETPASVRDIVMHFGNRLHEIDLFVDDGPRGGGVPSTVVLCTSGAPRVLREGAIPRAVLGID